MHKHPVASHCHVSEPSMLCLPLAPSHHPFPTDHYSSAASVIFLVSNELSPFSPEVICTRILLILLKLFFFLVSRTTHKLDTSALCSKVPNLQKMSKYSWKIVS